MEELGSGEAGRPSVEILAVEESGVVIRSIDSGRVWGLAFDNQGGEEVPVITELNPTEIESATE